MKTFGRFIRYRGQWNQTTLYQPGDMVQAHFEGEGPGIWAFAVCTAAHRNEPPTDAETGSGGTAFWDIEY